MELAGIKLTSPFIAAPMAGVTSPPFRLMAREGGAALVCSEMISAAGLARDQSKTWELARFHPEERPVSLQLFGADPKIMHLAAGLLAQLKPDLLDINLGCPVKKVRKTGAGSALAENPEAAAEVVAAVVAASSIPVMVKIRLGKAETTCHELAPKLAAAGAAAVCLHARTVNQGYGGLADWAAIARLKKECPVPVIGNGDVKNPEDALAMLERTGCDLVMIGRGAIGDPWLFGRCAAALAGRPQTPVTPQMRREALWRHLDLARDHGGEGHALHFVRQFMMWYTKGLPGAAAFRAEAGPLRDLARIIELSEQFFQSLQKGREQEA